MSNLNLSKRDYINYCTVGNSIMVVRCSLKALRVGSSPTSPASND